MRRLLQKFAKCRVRLVRVLIPLRSLRASAALFLFPLAAPAEPSARLDTPTTEAWTGQRISFFIELRAPGSFDGAPSFDIPRMPHSVVLRTGNPVLGTITEGDTEYLTQRHEFALFSQAQGEIELPTITARFSHKKGYTGPSYDVNEAVPAVSFTIRRPPGSEGLGFLVTTESFKVEEHWDPELGPVGTGAVFKRTIVQQASGLTGIALPPLPSDDIDGIRLYAGEPEITDRTDRGSLDGERRETVTYLIREAGLHTLPAIRFDWWNPKTETLESLTLPEVRFSATAPPPPPPPPSPWRFVWPALALGLVTFITLFRARLLARLRRLRDLVDPPRRRLERAFLKSCRIGDPGAAESFWSQLRAASPGLEATPELRAELLVLHHIRFRPGTEAVRWAGAPLAAAYRQASRRRHLRPTDSSPALPPLNF